MEKEHSFSIWLVSTKVTTCSCWCAQAAGLVCAVPPCHCCCCLIQTQSFLNRPARTACGLCTRSTSFGVLLVADLVITHALEWPSLTVQWLPVCRLCHEPGRLVTGLSMTSSHQLQQLNGCQYQLHSKVAGAALHICA
jgi:hypothetical protein